MKTNLSIIAIVFILFGSCMPESVEDVRKKYEELKKDSINYRNRQLEKARNKYKFEYFQDPNTGICYSIYKTHFYAHSYGDVNVISHTCVPCEEAGFTSFKKDSIK